MKSFVQTAVFTFLAAAVVGAVISTAVKVVDRSLARKIKQQGYEKKYPATLSGIESRRKRQKNFRSRNNNSSVVTDQTMDERLLHVNHEKKKAENKSFHCIQCQCSILDIVNEGERYGFSNKPISEKNHYFSFARFMSKNYYIYMNQTQILVFVTFQKIFCATAGSYQPKKNYWCV